jgi:hypothetical protein
MLVLSLVAQMLQQLVLGVILVLLLMLAWSSYSYRYLLIFIVLAFYQMLVTLSLFCNACWGLALGLIHFETWKDYYLLALLAVEVPFLMLLFCYGHAVYCRFKHFAPEAQFQQMVPGNNNDAQANAFRPFAGEGQLMG